ncbi:response regulator [Sphingomonas lenta]|uniref:Two-component system response regulator n=1 Tax=Sphingomonas lenta TaxID=1141887 RepID=A0A2A2SJ04_9SPHN|nr:response regulator [Sphingomonas lenta]PAX09203.1 two-component system response regulator [Sphingomonas lenta]
MTPSERLLEARLLLVDDEPANLALLDAVLRREGYRAIERVTDPNEAVARHLAFGSDLIVLDLMMPGIDGYALLDALHRLTPADALMPILVLTADTTIDAKRRALSLGAKDVMTKPFDVFELALRVGNLLDMRFLVERLRVARFRAGQANA